MKYPKVSVIVAAYNEERDIPDLLKSLKECNYPKKNLEVIVVDDGSIDRTKEIVKEFGFKLIAESHKGISNARNLGWKQATGEIIVFIDADMVLDKNYVMEAVKYLQAHKDVVAVEGREFLYNKENLLARMHHLKHELGMSQKKIYIPRVYRRRVLEQFNGFNDEFGYYLDWELYKRILSKGLKIGHTNKAIIYNKPVESFKELFNQCRWNGRSIVFIFKKYKIDAIRRTAFVLLNALVPFYIILLLLPMPFKMLGVIGLSVFFTIETIRSLRMFLITKWWESFLTPIYDVISMILILYGMVDKFINDIKVPVG